VTASSVHDPESAGGKQGIPATLGGLKGFEAGGDWEMVDGGPYNGDKVRQKVGTPLSTKFWFMATNFILCWCHGAGLQR